MGECSGIGVGLLTMVVPGAAGGNGMGRALGLEPELGRP